MKGFKNEQISFTNASFAEELDDIFAGDNTKDIYIDIRETLLCNGILKPGKAVFGPIKIVAEDNNEHNLGVLLMGDRICAESEYEKIYTFFHDFPSWAFDVKISRDYEKYFEDHHSNRYVSIDNFEYENFIVNNGEVYTYWFSVFDINYAAMEKDLSKIIYPLTIMPYSENDDYDEWMAESLDNFFTTNQKINANEYIIDHKFHDFCIEISPNREMLEEYFEKTLKKYYSCEIIQESIGVSTIQGPIKLIPTRVIGQIQEYKMDYSETRIYCLDAELKKYINWLSDMISFHFEHNPPENINLINKPAKGILNIYKHFFVPKSNKAIIKILIDGHLAHLAESIV